MLFPALLDSEEDDPNDLRELKVDLNNLEAVPVAFEFKLLLVEAVLGRGGILPSRSRTEHGSCQSITCRFRQTGKRKQAHEC